MKNILKVIFLTVLFLAIDSSANDDKVQSIFLKARFWNQECTVAEFQTSCAPGKEIISTGISIPLLREENQLRGEWQQQYKSGNDSYTALVVIKKYDDEDVYNVNLTLYDSKLNWDSPMSDVWAKYKKMDDLVFLQVNGPTTAKDKENKAFKPYFDISASELALLD
jgi:hypothetical protein